jgi:hypothetical protein
VSASLGELRGVRLDLIMASPRLSQGMLSCGERGDPVVRKHHRTRAADRGTQLRNSAVPSPHRPLTIGPIKMPGTRKTSATGRPFS